MPLKKPRKCLTVGILVPCYHRNEYTEKCLHALNNAQKYNATFYTPCHNSLRDVIIDFIGEAKKNKFDFIAKIDNDCVVPKNWFNDMLDIFNETDVDILSPNVFPSNAAFKYGEDSDLPYRPSKIVGGLWCMRRKLIDSLVFEKYDVKGITGAFNILKQIINETSPKVGWADKVVVQDVGHWSGKHRDHIKSEAHKKYSEEVGRNTQWG